MGLMSFPQRSGSAGGIYLSFLLGGTFVLATYLYSGNASGDDTFIYMRYIENALNGHGLTFNPGEPSYGVTSAAWTFLMLPIAYTFSNTVLVWKATGAALTGLRSSVLFSLFRQFRLSHWHAVLLSIAAMAEPHTFRWSASGMENALTALVLTLLVWAHIRFHLIRSNQSAVVLGFLVGLSTFVRPELFVFVATIAIYFVISRKGNHRLLFCTAALSVFLISLGVTYSVFGAVVPQTAAAKAIFLHQTSRTYGLSQSFVILLSGALGCVILLASKVFSVAPLRSLRIAGVISALVLIAFYGFNNQLISTRYATVLALPIVLIAMLGAAHLVAESGRLRRSVTGLLALQFVLSIALLVFFFPATRTSEQDDIRALAQRVNELTDNSSRIALTEIGAFGFYSQRYIIDLSGLTDRATLDWGRTHGLVNDTEKLESLLISRRATHYINAFSDESILRGNKLNFVPIAEGLVTRNNLSRARLYADRWRVYRIEARSSRD
jgi:arabinofuranosyltransferase